MVGVQAFGTIVQKEICSSGSKHGGPNEHQRLWLKPTTQNRLDLMEIIPTFVDLYNDIHERNSQNI